MNDGGALNQKHAAAYLDVEESWLDDAPVPWVDMRKPGASRATRRYRRVDLDAFLASRVVPAGHPSPWGAP